MRAEVAVDGGVLEGPRGGGAAGEARSGERLRALAASAPGAPPAACVHCGAAEPRSWGATRAGVPRLRCGACGRSFTALTGTWLAGVRLMGKLLLVLEDMLSAAPSSCRALARRLGLHPMTIWRWRGRIAGALAAGGADRPEPATAAAASLRESRKASREWVRHERDPARYPKPDRLRWHEYPRLRLPAPNGPRYRVPVLVVADRAGGLRALTGAPPPGSDDGPLASALRGRLAGFLGRFRGPATRHLAGYLAWFGAWSAAGAAEAEPLGPAA
jgi:transposase-like protein